MDETREVLDPADTDYIRLTADVVAAYLSNNHVQVAEVSALLASVHGAFRGLGQSAPSTAPETNRPTPLQMRRSIRPDALISFEDAKPYKTLKRHITKLGLSPETYREKWGLPLDYPMTAASYSEQRSKLALALGLGQHRKKSAPKLSVVAETIPGAPEHDGASASSLAKPAKRRGPRVAAAEKAK
ncbi:hypothetical protein ADL19_05630 [Streptomyces purpurogeneiscleroticus]|nr:hypothetical protein ADL19_05630 [Streptomyces purpurogeneiscleroticus]